MRGVSELVITTADIVTWLGSFVWPFTRIAAMFSIAPVIGSRLVPMRIRAALAFWITIAVTPIIGSAPAADPLSASGLLIGVNQLLIGLAMGFVLHVVFAAAMLAGEQVAMAMGLGFAQMADPQNGVQVPVVGQFFVVFSTLLFLALNGDRALIQMVVTSFELLPIGVIGIGRAELWALVQWGSHLFSGALLIALPGVIALLAVNLAMGVITRAAPQMNIISVGFPATVWLGFVIVLFGLPAYFPVFTALLEEGFETATLFRRNGN